MSDDVNELLCIEVCVRGSKALIDVVGPNHKITGPLYVDQTSYHHNEGKPAQGTLNHIFSTARGTLINQGTLINEMLMKCKSVLYVFCTSLCLYTRNYSVR